MGENGEHGKGRSMSSPVEDMKPITKPIPGDNAVMGGVSISDLRSDLVIFG